MLSHVVTTDDENKTFVNGFPISRELLNDNKIIFYAVSIDQAISDIYDHISNVDNKNRRYMEIELEKLHSLTDDYIIKNIKDNMILSESENPKEWNQACEDILLEQFTLDNSLELLIDLCNEVSLDNNLNYNLLISDDLIELDPKIRYLVNYYNFYMFTIKDENKHIIDGIKADDDLMSDVSLLLHYLALSHKDTFDNLFDNLIDDKVLREKILLNIKKVS